MEPYDHKKLEWKWQEYWRNSVTFAADDKAKGERAYVLDMFPYPSAQGLHVGHPEGYTATDIYCRYLRMKGVNVLHPMGWDAFGLPAENYAIKTGRHPKEVTWENIDNFRRQIQSLGFSYDWSREVNTADPAYYRWTQWLFLKLYEKGLAYRKEAPVNWCPSCQTVLANEQVVNGECERCHSNVEQRNMKQWFFKTTAYAERLLDELKGLDWPKPIMDMQANWIGKSEGAEVDFPIAGSEHKVRIFTTRLDTIFGATYMVLAPEHELVRKLKDKITNWPEVQAYAEQSEKKTELERKVEEKSKTGVRLEGVEAVNPANHEHVPVFIADYVLTSYGTGAIMAVPAHDERDFEFAKKFGLAIRQVIEPCFVQKTEPGAVRQGLPFVERQAITAIVKHWSEDKYIGLKWKKVDWDTFITGGVEAGQTPEQAAKAEIIEETGYLNPKLVQTFGMEHSRFFHVPKNENRFAHFHNFFFQLENDARQDLAQGEGEMHDVVWLTQEEMNRFKLPEPHRYLWSVLQNGETFYTGEGILAQSGKFSGMDSAAAIPAIAKYIGAELKTQYRLRDWLISRQRYWGAPIPIIYCETCGEVPVREKDLPVALPEDVDFRPQGESPLQRSKIFHNVTCPTCGKAARRESDTMDTFVDSSWYFLRYCDPKNEQEAFDKKKVSSWCPVNLYVGGAEHAVLHLLYARFFTKFLQDAKYVEFGEPFLKLRNQGLILGEDGQKMSKSRGNVVNPDEIVKEHGADTLRLYEMFMGPLEDAKPWNTSSIIGVRRFLERVWFLSETIMEGGGAGSPEQAKFLSRETARVTKKVTEGIEQLNLNTSIASMMELTNALSQMREVKMQAKAEAYRKLLLLLYPFAPHVTSELWGRLKFGGQVWEQGWPDYDEAALKEDSVTVTVQVNGKVRGSVQVPSGASESEVVTAARAEAGVTRHIAGKQTVRTVYVPGRLVNFVVS